MRYARFVCRREAESLSGPNDLPVSIKEKRARIVVAVLTRTAETVGAGIAPSASLSDQEPVMAATSEEISRLAVHDCDDPSK